MISDYPHQWDDPVQWLGQYAKVSRLNVQVTFNTKHSNSQNSDMLLMDVAISNTNLILNMYLVSIADGDGGSPSGRDIFCLKNFDTFPRTPVRVSKMNFKC